MDTGQHDLTLDELKAVFGLSVRAYNVCTAAGLLTLSNIMVFRVENGGFKKLKRSGVTTDYELNELLDRALNAGYGYSVGSTSPSVSFAGSLDAWFDTRFFKLSRLAQKTLLELIGELSAVKAVEFYSQDDVVSKLTGPPTRIKELADLGVQLLAVAGSLPSTLRSTGLPEQEDTTGTLRWMKRHAIPSEYRTFLFDKYGRMTLFRFLEEVLLKRTVKASKQEVFEACTRGKGFHGRYVDLADLIGMTKERARQLVQEIQQELPNDLAFLLDVPGASEHYPQLQFTEPVKVIDTSVSKPLNREEGTDWSPLFIMHVIRLLGRNHYHHMPWEELGVMGHESKRLDYTTPVLVHRELSRDLERLMVNMDATIDTQRAWFHMFDPATLVHDPDPDRAQQLLEAMRTVVKIRYPGWLLGNGMLRLPPNKLPSRVEQLRAVLTALDRPARMPEIVTEWNIRYPHRQAYADLIRSIVTRYPESFFSIGRSSTYGLRQWEQEREGVKGGTIRNIVQEELLKAGGPVSVDRILEAVLRFRSTTRNNVLTNLMLCETPQFVLLSGDRIALAGMVDGTPIEPGQPDERLPLRRKDVKPFIGQPLTELKAYMIEKLHYTDAEATQALASRLRKGRLAVDQNGLIIPGSSTQDPEDQSPDQFAVPEE